MKAADPRPSTPRLPQPQLWEAGAHPAKMAAGRSPALRPTAASGPRLAVARLPTLPASFQRRALCVPLPDAALLVARAPRFLCHPGAFPPARLTAAPGPGIVHPAPVWLLTLALAQPVTTSCYVPSPILARTCRGMALRRGFFLQGAATPGYST